MADLRDYGPLLLASRLKRVSETLYAGVDAVYEEQGVALSSRCFPILFLLKDHGPMGVTELAKHLGQSHPAVSQMSQKLLAHGAVAEKSDARDERRRLLALSPKGRALMERMTPVWEAVTGAVEELTAAAGSDLLGALTSFEGSLDELSFDKRIKGRMALRTGDQVEIIPFEPRYRDDFQRLNVEWLEKHFYVEAIDQEVLSRPERAIVERGGFVFLARYRAEIVGTCALIKAGPSRYELSKMAVTERYQGLRIGYKLLLAALAQFEKTGAKELFLESSSKLEAALRLYEANGFVHAPKPKGTPHYQRSDVYMVYRSRAASDRATRAARRR